MSTRIKVEMKPVNTIVARLGVGKDGDVQRFATNTINRRIGRYMPHLTGTMETKLKHVTGPAEITVEGPYAKYQYYGKVMVGKAPKKATDRNLEYTKTFNPNAVPFWDKALMAAEGAAIKREVQAYVNRKAGKR